MRHLKFSSAVLLTLSCSLVLSGCSGSLVTNSSAAAGSLTVSSSTVDFGQVAVGNTASNAITLTNKGAAAVEISALNLTGQPFTISGGGATPMTVGANASVTVNVQFGPTASGAATGQLTITSNASSGSSTSVALSGVGVPMLTGLNCVNGSILGSAADTCTVSLNAAAGSNGQAVSLTSNDSAVVVPASVTVPAGANSVDFTADASAVTSTQAAMLTANEGGVAQTFAVELDAATAVLAVSASSLTFHSTPVNSPATNSLVLSSTGTMPVTVSAASVTGANFTISAGGLPVTLAPGQTTTLSVQFDPTAAGAANGQLSLTSNSAGGSSTVIGLSGTGVPVLTTLSCSSATVTGSATDSCTATLNAAAASGGFVIGLSSSNALATVPASVTVAAGTSSVNFIANVSPVNSAETAILTANAGGISEIFTLALNAGAPILSLSTSSVDFGDAVTSVPATQTVVLSSTGNSAVTVSATSLSGTGFAASGATFPLTLNPNQTATLTLQFDPTATGSTTGELDLTSTSSDGALKRIGLQGRGVPRLTELSCGNTKITGAGTDNCTVAASAAIPIGGLTVSLRSNNSSFVVPASLTLPAGSTSGSFSATVSAVNVAQAVTVSATATGISASAGVQLQAASVALGVSSSSLSFGNVNVNTASSQTLTLSSNGSSAVTVSAASVAGTGFTISGATFPLTLNPNQTATLTVQFDPSTARVATGQLTLNSNAVSGTSTLINLSGTGVPALTALSCANRSFTGAGTDSCTVTLNVAAAAGGFSVSVASNNSAVTVPATVTVAPGAATGSFTATIAATTTAETVTLTASAGGVTQTFGIQLGTGVPTLSINATSISFGDVIVGSPATQSVTLSSTGAAPVTVSAASVSGTGFSVSGATFPLTLNPTQTATLSVEFNPISALLGLVSGSLTISSNSSTSPTAVISLGATGETVQVNLTWDAPSSSPDPVAGYNVYRALSGGTSYQQVNTSAITQTTYVDTTVQAGQTYDYIVESVDAAGNISSPSNMASVPTP
jgi:Abnormal spindle-like microcephaly-assoc'd, ASPM-SPD-2-Hydin